MEVEIDVLRQRNAELEAKIGDLSSELTEVKNENVKLRQIIEENAKRDAENAELKTRIEELEKNRADTSSENAKLRARIAKLEQNFGQSQDETVHDEAVNMSTSSVVDHCDDVSSFSSCESKKTIKDIETDEFLDSEHKKKVSNEVREHNKKNKLLHESSSQETLSISQDTASVSYHERKNE
jgi:regulator of replication initiation timing